MGESNQIYMQMKEKEFCTDGSVIKTNQPILKTGIMGNTIYNAFSVPLEHDSL